MVDTGAALMDVPALAVTLIVGATVLILVYVSNLFRATASEETKTGAPASAAPKKEKQDKHHHHHHPAAGAPASAAFKKEKQDKQGGKKKQQHAEKWSRDAAKQFTHPWLLTSLKGHSGQILDMDFSSNGKYLATCADDRSVLLWHTRDWTQKEHKHVRVNVELDHATLVRWSPDSKAFVLRRDGDNALEVFRVSRKADGLLGAAARAASFPKMCEESIVGLGVACSGRFMLACSESNQLRLSDIKGQQLATVDTELKLTHSARVSPCGRFVAATGSASKAKVWEVVFSKSGSYQSIVPAFELTGHTSGVFDVAFNPDTTLMATVSEDGTWRLYDTNVEYKKRESPKLLKSQKYAMQSGFNAHIALSPTGDVVVVASGNSIHFYVTRTGELDRTIDSVFSGPITALLFDSTGKLVLASGEKHVRVFHNVTGQREIAVTLRERLHPSLSSAQQERMLQQIADAEGFLASLGETS